LCLLAAEAAISAAVAITITVIKEIAMKTLFLALALMFMGQAASAQIYFEPPHHHHHHYRHHHDRD
jgi:hypothetical protein